jgi:hypothetical protein
MLLSFAPEIAISGHISQSSRGAAWTYDNPTTVLLRLDRYHMLTKELRCSRVKGDMILLISGTRTRAVELS